MINQQPIAQYLRKNAEVLCDFPEINGVTQTVKYMTKFHVWENYAPWKCPILTLSWRGPLLYRNQSIDLQSKSMDWFLYDNDLRHERVKMFWVGCVTVLLKIIRNTSFFSDSVKKRFVYVLVNTNFVETFIVIWTVLLKNNKSIPPSLFSNFKVLFSNLKIGHV